MVRLTQERDQPQGLPLLIGSRGEEVFALIKLLKEYKPLESHPGLKANAHLAPYNSEVAD